MPGEYSSPLLAAASKKEYSLREYALGEYSSPLLTAALKKEYSLGEYAPGEYSAAAYLPGKPYLT